MKFFVALCRPSRIHLRGAVAPTTAWARCRSSVEITQNLRLDTRIWSHLFETKAITLPSHVRILRHRVSWSGTWTLRYFTGTVTVFSCQTSRCTAIRCTSLPFLCSGSFSSFQSKWCSELVYTVVFELLAMLYYSPRLKSYIL